MKKRVSREELYAKGRNHIALFVILVAIILATFTLDLISDFVTFVSLSLAIILFFTLFIVNAIYDKAIYLEPKGRLKYLGGKKEIIYCSESPKTYWKYIRYMIIADVIVALVFVFSLLSIL